MNERPARGRSGSTSISQAGASSRSSIRTVEDGLSTRYRGSASSDGDTGDRPAPGTKGVAGTGGRAPRARHVKSAPTFAGSMAAKRTAEAVWENDLIHGSGRVKGTSGALPEMPISWAARTEAPGGKTSPEELLAAAHASCFSMALSAGLGRLQKPPQRIQVTATATFDKVGEGWKVTSMELNVVGTVPGLSAAEFETAAQGAGQNCPISAALKGNVPITVHARLG